MAADKRAFICEKLLDMMEEQDFFSIKATAFIKYAGISRSTFYFYFDSLYDVLQKIEDDFMDGLLPESEIVRHSVAKQPTKVNSGFISKVGYIEQHKRTLRTLTSENGDPSFAVKLVNRNKRIVRQTLAVRPDLGTGDVELMAEYIAAGQIQALKWWVNHEDQMELCDLLLSLERYVTALYQSVD